MAIGQTLVLAGRKMNALERVAAVNPSAIVFTPTADASTPVAQLYDGLASLLTKFGSNAATPDATVDSDLLGNFGDFEVWTGGASSTPDGWTEEQVGTGSPAVTQNTNGAHVQRGASSTQFFVDTGGTGTALIRRDVEVRTGERLFARVYLKSDGVTSMFVRIQNLLTNKYLNGSGEWVFGTTNLFLHSSGSLSPSSITFDVESMATCQLADLATLRISIGVTGSGGGSVTCWADLCTLIPVTNFLSVHGHTFDAAHADFEVLASDSSTFSSGNVLLVDSQPMRQPSFYNTWADNALRYYSIRPNGSTNSAASGAPGYAEVILGRTTTLLRSMRPGPELRYAEDDVAHVTPGGEMHVYPLSKWSRRVLGMQFDFVGQAQMEQARDEVFRRARGRVYPMVVVPDANRSDVLLGRIQRDWKVQRVLTNLYQGNDLMLLESPFPNLTQ